MDTKKLLIETWLDPDPDDRITTHDLYCAAMEAVERIESLEAENADLLKDRERLEFLSKNDTHLAEYGEGWSLTCWSRDSAIQTAPYKNWRDGIDEAMRVGGK